jgi:hypothetical protein
VAGDCCFDCCCDAQNPGEECCKAPGKGGICCLPEYCCGTEEEPVCCNDETQFCCQTICCLNEETCCGTEEDPVCCAEDIVCCDGVCCAEGECCNDGVCEPCEEPCESDEDCEGVLFDYNGTLYPGVCCDGECKHPFQDGCCYDTEFDENNQPFLVVIGPAADIDDDCTRINQSYVFDACPCPDDDPP